MMERVTSAIIIQLTRPMEIAIIFATAELTLESVTHRPMEKPEDSAGKKKSRRKKYTPSMD